MPPPPTHEQTGKLRHQEEDGDVLTGAEDCGFAPTHLFPFHSQGKAAFPSKLWVAGRAGPARPAEGSQT